MNYFQNTAFVSNSELSEFKRIMNVAPEQDRSKAYNMGSLVDAMITEESQIATFAESVTEGELKKAEMMAIAGKADPTLASFLQAPDTRLQHEIYKNKFRVEYEGEVVFLPFKMKLDLLRRSYSLGGDIKTTDCPSFQAFINSIDFFDYDRQGFVYMEGAGLDYFTFIGISKRKNRFTRKHDVFKYAIRRDDETFNRGKAKFNFLAYRYYHLVYQLNLNYEL